MGKTLVIVDDAPFIREVVRQIVASSDIQVVGEAADGIEAIEVVKRTKPQLVLMDIVMPKKSGIDAAREILEQWPDIKILACSTLDQETMVMKAIDAGCYHYIVKPFSKESLLRALDQAHGG